MEIYNNHIAIVTVGYNRKASMQRLIDSLNRAEYDNQKVDLIISLDRSDCIDEMVDMANQVQWEHGEKKIRTFPERQGLRKHILQCGDLTSEYDAVVVLEDDLIVSRWFYHYVSHAVERYSTEDRIAGISLYTHLLVPGIGCPFSPSQNGYDAFFMQFAQSWGQCWTKAMWKGFRQWYDQQSGKLQSDEIIPAYVAAWDDKSWLKYYIKYVAETNKFFVYPYQSLTTNVGEVGEHYSAASTMFQVPLMNGKIDYDFPSIEQGVKYDVFFERIWDSDEILPEYVGKKIIDLYATKTKYEDADYLISTRELPYKVVESIELQYRPHEENMIYRQAGQGIYVYDLKDKADAPVGNKMVKIEYELRGYDWKKTVLYSLERIWQAIKKRLLKVKRK